MDKQILRDKMEEMFAKIITDIDKQVMTVSESQQELDSQLDRLISTLDSIKIDEELTDEISANAKRISSLRSRLTLIHTILSNSSARCSKTLAACGAAVNSLNALISPTQTTPSPPIPEAQPAPKAPNSYRNDRRLSLNIVSSAPRRLSLTVDSTTSSALKEAASQGYAGNATGSLRNKVALKPGHSLMGWSKFASSAKDLSGTNGKIVEVTPEELVKHDKESDCWIALKGNVYNVTSYLQYHPGGVEEMMRGAGRDATELFEEVHRWVNYESILAKCLVGPYKFES